MTNTIKVHRKASATSAHIIVSGAADTLTLPACEGKLLEETLYAALPRDTYLALRDAMLNRSLEQRLREIATQYPVS